MKIAIVSGKGGSGKSSITAAFIAHLAPVIAVDCDVDASNLPLLFQPQIEEQIPFASGHDIRIDYSKCIGCKHCIDACAYHAITLKKDKPYVNPLLCEGCALCTHICPTKAISLNKEWGSTILRSQFEYGRMIHGNLKPGDDNSGLMIAEMRRHADEDIATTNTPIQLLDGPPGIGCPVLSTITGVDKVVIVSEPTLSGLSDLKRIYQVTISFTTNIYVIINKANINKVNTAEITSFCNNVHIPIIAEIPYNKIFVEAQMQGKDILSYAPSSPISHLLRQAANSIS